MNLNALIAALMLVGHVGAAEQTATASRAATRDMLTPWVITASERERGLVAIEPGPTRPKPRKHALPVERPEQLAELSVEGR